CSLIRMPGTLVSVAANGPPLAWPGFRSNVSIWLGPPLIHSRTHDRLRCGFAAASAASASSQPDDEQPTTPAADSRSQSRRDRPERLLRDTRESSVGFGLCGSSLRR